MSTNYFAAPGVEGVKYFAFTQENGTLSARMRSKRKPAWEQSAELTTTELQAGKDFEFDDGSLLKIQLIDNVLTLTRNGQVCPPISTPVEELVDRNTLRMAKNASGVVAFVGYGSALLYLLLAMVSLLNGESIISILPPLTILLIPSIVFIILSIFVFRYSLIALLITCALYSMAILFFELPNVLQQILTLSFGGLWGFVIQIVCLYFMLRAIGPFRRIRDARAKEKTTQDLLA